MSLTTQLNGNVELAYVNQINESQSWVETPTKLACANQNLLKEIRHSENVRSQPV